MRILLTNDDGVYAAGIREISKLLCNEHEIYIVAPSAEKSGASQSITIHRDLILEEVKINELPSAHIYSLTGTPADCVKFALGTLDIKPDLIISGINMGANIGTDVMYSGTVGAGLEAAIAGYPTVALSVCSHNPLYLADAAQVCKTAVDFYIKNIKVCKLLNVNVPNIPLCDIKGFKVTHLSKRQYPASYEKQNDGSYRMPSWSFAKYTEHQDCDEYYIGEGYATMTPLLIDICDCNMVENVKEAFKRESL